jgi:hypothetical protein
MQERRRRRLPRTAQSSQRPRQLQLRVGDGVHGLAWPPRAAARWLGGAVHSDLQLPPHLQILPLFFSFLLLLLFSGSWWMRRTWMRSTPGGGGRKGAPADGFIGGGALGFGCRRMVGMRRGRPWRPSTRARMAEGGGHGASALHSTRPHWVTPAREKGEEE